MGKNKKMPKSGDIRREAMNLLELIAQENKIHRVVRKKSEKVCSMLKTYCDDKDIQGRIANNEEASQLIQEVISSISKIQQLVNQ